MEVEHKPFAQKRPDQLVYLELGAGNGGMLLSLSEDGFRFRAVSPVRANVAIPFAFSLDGKHRLEGSGTLEWLEADGKSGGVRFTEVSEEFLSAVTHWLALDVSHPAPSREVTPAVATPLDTMEKIRQELRAGYPPSGHPAEPIGRLMPSELKTNSSSPARNMPERKLKPVFSERNTEPKEPRTASKLFSPPVLNPTETEKSAVAVSAFLKRPHESKPLPTVLSAPPTRRVTPLGATSVASAMPGPAHAAAESRPYIPPLEESFESAWERAKLSAPPDSPHLSRAAAGSIIAIALAVILGALAYNFRQDIGSAFIHLGQEISGGSPNVPSAPAQQAPADGQLAAQPNADQKSSEPPQTSSTETRSVAQSSDSSHSAAANGAPARNGSAQPGSAEVSGASAAPPAGKPHETSPVQVPPDAVGAAAELGMGQEEFKAAREILQGGNRQREMPRAVDLLWSGVRKGYVPAEVTLADLFLRGDGVEKNCDQARVLLVAASKKGSFDARQMLEQMAEQGCE